MGRRISRRSVISRLLDEAASPIYLLHADGTIAYANAALGRWLGLSPDSLIGLRCPYSAQSASPVAGLSPPPVVFTGEPSSAQVWRGLTGGGTESRQAEFLPLGSGGEEGKATVMAIVSDDLCEPDSASPRAPVIGSRPLHEQLWQLRAEVADGYSAEHLIGQTPAMQRVRLLTRAAAHHPGNVIVVGAEGTGREHVARTIHRATTGASLGSDADWGSAFPLAPMTALSAPLLDLELLEATVASFLQRCAELEMPGLPTLLLLDADQLEDAVQQALFDLLEVHELALRCISTSRQSLIGLARSGTYHQGLGFALSSLEIELPPLDERLADIPLLVQYFVEQWNLDAKKQVQGFTEEAMGHFLVYPWSTHLLELRGLVHEACRAADTAMIGVESLPFPLRAAVDASLFQPPPPPSMPLDALLAETEIKAIETALELAKGNRAQAARLLQISRARLLRRLDHFDLQSDPAAPRQEGDPMS